MYIVLRTLEEEALTAVKLANEMRSSDVLIEGGCTLDRHDQIYSRLKYQIKVLGGGRRERLFEND